MQLLGLTFAKRLGLSAAIRVAMITRDYPPKIGGIAAHTRDFVNGLRKLGVKVDVFAGFTDLKTIAIQFRKDLGGYDIVHVQSTPYGPFISKGPLIVTAHAPISTEWNYYNLTNKLKALVAYPLEFLTIKNADSVIAVSSYTKNELVRRYKARADKIVVIPHGVNYERFSPDGRVDSETPRILLCSRLELRKNVDEALRAFLALSFCQFKVKIVGSGPQQKNFEQKVANMGSKIEFIGPVAWEDLPGYYANSDIFVTTSFSEGFGISLLQAMSSGCAVVASDIPAHRELVKHMVNGILYSNFDSLVASLKLLIRDREVTKRLGNEARNFALKFSWERAARLTLQVYQRVLKPLRRPD